MRSTDYVDALRAKLACKSDYELSKRLGLAHNVIGRYRKGGTFDNAMSVRTAELLEIDPLEVIGDMELQRASTDAQRDHWARFLTRFARVAASATPALLLAPHLAELSPLFILCKTRHPQNHVSA